MARPLSLLRPLAILAVAGVIAFAMLKNKPQIESRSAATPPPNVDVQRVTLGDTPVTVVAYGNVTAWEKLDLIANCSCASTRRITNSQPRRHARR